VQGADAVQTPANSAPAVSPPSSATSGVGTSAVAAPHETAPAQGAPAQEPAPTTLSIGVDAYSGISNLTGYKRYSDGFWAAGAGPAYPSIAYLKWQESNGATAKFAYGTGDLYRGRNSIVTQPVEAWYQRPLGKFSLTAGKFWVPFALQEWQYETKWGVQLQRTFGSTNVTGSVNYDRVTHDPICIFALDTL
jgi:hypothetical protein